MRMLMYERNIVTPLILSKNFQSYAFLAGFPAQTDFMTSTHRMSIPIVSRFSKINYIAG
jgi:hypothetical protein